MERDVGSSASRIEMILILLPESFVHVPWPEHKWCSWGREFHKVWWTDTHWQYKWHFQTKNPMPFIVLCFRFVCGHFFLCGLTFALFRILRKLLSAAALKSSVSTELQNVLSSIAIDTPGPEQPQGCLTSLTFALVCCSPDGLHLLRVLLSYLVQSIHWALVLHYHPPLLLQHHSLLTDDPGVVLHIKDEGLHSALTFSQERMNNQQQSNSSPQSHGFWISSSSVLWREREREGERDRETERWKTRKIWLCFASKGTHISADFVLPRKQSYCCFQICTVVRTPGSFQQVVEKENSLNLLPQNKVFSTTRFPMPKTQSPMQWTKNK